MSTAKSKNINTFDCILKEDFKIALFRWWFFWDYKVKAFTLLRFVEVNILFI